MKAVNHELGIALLFQPRCKRWSCPPCAEINKRLWVARADFGAQVFEALTQPIAFLTLTSHRRLAAAGSLAVLPDAWKVLRTRAVRQAVVFEYFMVPERHQDGRVHLHAIETSGLGTRWWKDNAAACGLGYMAEEDDISVASGAAYYAGKYLNKTLEGQSWPKGFHRVRTSGKWPQLPDAPQPEDWTFAVFDQGDSLEKVQDRFTSGGYEVQLLDHAAAWQFVNQNTLE